jgi:ArsR family transcriptional regulator, arsenate/arsenite/antimonite-responsive transcriptional repressor
MTAPAAASRGALPLADDCCAPLLREPLTQAQAADLAHVLKALADPTRLRLVSMVAAHVGGEACVCELTEPLGLTQPTISHHLKILVDAGIFSRDKRGVWAWYALRPAALQALAAILGGTAPPGVVTRALWPAATDDRTSSYRPAVLTLTSGARTTTRLYDAFARQHPIYHDTSRDLITLARLSADASCPAWIAKTR